MTLFDWLVNGEWKTAAKFKDFKVQVDEEVGNAVIALNRQNYEIRAYIDEQDAKTLQQVQDIIKQNEALKSQNEALGASVQDLSSQLQELEGVVAERPSWLAYGMAYPPTQLIVHSDGSIDSMKFSPTDFYPVFDELKRLVAQREWRMLETDEEKFRHIWDYCVQQVAYTPDYAEDWKWAANTNALRKDDCEGYAVLFVTLARISGVSAAKVFNACGTFSGIGHSFPICVHADKRLYVYECTLGRLPAAPMELKQDSVYQVGSLQNWGFQGFLNWDNYVGSIA